MRASPDKAGGGDHPLNPCATAHRTRASEWPAWGGKAASARGSMCAPRATSTSVSTAGTVSSADQAVNMSRAGPANASSSLSSNRWVSRSTSGTCTASQFGLDPRLVPSTREVPRPQKFRFGILAADLVAQEQLEQRGRTRVDRFAQGKAGLLAALAGIGTVLEQQLGDVPGAHPDRQAERGIPEIRVSVLMEKDPHQVRISSPDRGHQGGL